MANGLGGAALERIHSKRIEAKMFRNALGFLQGLVADGRINPMELQALHTYMLDCADHFDHGDIIDVLDVTADLVEKAKLDIASEQDLLGVIDCIIEYQCPEEASRTEKMEEFLGLCSGIVADDLVKQSEAEKVRDWLANNAEIVNEWPANDIARRLNVFLTDGKLDGREATNILEAMKHLVGGSFAETGATAIGLPIEVKQHLAQGVEFEGRSFCFTGTFFFGSRAECEAITAQMGGTLAKGVSKKLDYLVVGSIASPFWLTSHFGTKIQKVMSMRDKAFPYLVGEDVWRQSLAL